MYRNIARDKATRETEFFTLCAVGFIVFLVVLNSAVYENNDKVSTTKKEKKNTT